MPDLGYEHITYYDDTYLHFIVETKTFFTYVHNWPLQSFSQDYGLGSHTTHIVCVNFIREWRDLQFNSFEEIFHGSFIYS